MKPLYHHCPLYIVMCLTLIGLPLSTAFADQKKIDISEVISEPMPMDVKKEIYEDLNHDLKKIQKTSNQLNELRALQKAQQSGLSTLIKRISPKGGKFEIQSDGAIRIIPEDDSIVKKLLSSESLSESSNSTETAHAPPKVTTSLSQKSISETEKKIMGELQQAENKGLASLLKKLAPKGGKFELTENGGVRITPDDASKSKELYNVSGKAKKVAEQRKLKSLSKSLKPIGQPVNTWQKVRKAADSWLLEQKKEGLIVGKIRRVKRLFIVSIVTEKGRLDSQIVMRVSDGKAVVFSQKDFEVLN